MTDTFDGTFLAGVERRRVRSEATGSEHDVFIGLPDGWEHSGRRYPLLIVLDANYCFGTALETARMQAATGEAAELIVVGLGSPGGVAAHGVKRLRDYTPGFHMEGGLAASEVGRMLQGRLERAGLSVEQAFGGSRPYARFITDELLPTLRAELPIEESDIGLAGHSCGGAFAVDLLLNGARPFSKLLVGTFGLDWFKPADLERLERGFAGHRDLPRVFVAIGGAEFDDEEMGRALPHSTAFLDRLRTAAPGLELTQTVFEGETHTSVMAMLLSSGIRRLWATGLSYSAAAAGRRAREDATA